MLHHRINSLKTAILIILILFAAMCRKTVQKPSEFASTYLGGIGHEFCEAITVDDDGNIYVAGNTRSPDFPTTASAYNRDPKGESDVFIAKFDNGLKTLLASTLIGGDEGECAYTMLYDPQGYVYVAGYTSSENFPTTDRSYDTSYNGGEGDAFILKMDKDLINLVASTFLGGSGAENDWRSPELVQDGEGNLYIAGITASEDFPTTSGAFQETYNGGARDVFLAKFDPDLQELLASTLLGGEGDDRMGRSLGISATTQEICVGGYTYSPDFPTSQGAYGREVSGQLDGFVTKLSLDLTEVTASTILDGGWTYCMLLHENGDIYVGGHAANRLPTTSGAFYQDFDKAADQGFISRLSGDLTKLVSSTAIPGSYASGGGRICSLNLCQSEDGHILSAGWTRPLDFPITPGVYDETQNGNADSYILKMDSDLSHVLSSTFLGGSRSERWNRMATDGKGSIYLASYTLSGDLPTSEYAAFPSFGSVIDDEEEDLNKSARDAFIVRVDENLAAETFEESHEAAKRDEVDKLRKLLSKDEIRLEKRDKYQRTPLHSAARYGAMSAARFLLEQGADPNARDERGDAPLHLASIFSYDDMVELLIRYKADVDLLNAQGQAPLILASLYGNAPSIRSLLAGGAQINIRDTEGSTLLHIAALYQNHENIAALLEGGPEIDEANSEGDTPLHQAVRRSDNLQAVELLLQHGADANTPDRTGKNVLQVAAASNQKDYIRILVSQGIDINSQDGDGNTALHYPLNNAVRNRMFLPYITETVKVLMEEGADPLIKNKEGKSPLDLAREIGEDELLGLLESPEKRLRQEQSIEEWEERTFIKQPPQKVMDAAGIKPGMAIGEVGAGRGRFTLHLARRIGAEGKILANDIDAEALAYLRERCQKAGFANVETILGEVDDPNYPEGSLDMVFMVWTYHFFDQPVTMLRKLLPTLKPGGTIVLVEPDPIRGPGGGDHGISPERMRRDAAQAGFEVVRVDNFLPEDLFFILKIRD
jgi:ankyrin repeat protein/predicted O-methyltransferase YrrM